MEERRPIIKISASAPANIALIKYWGKRGFQLPQNASLSLTLDQMRASCNLTYIPCADFKLAITLNENAVPEDDRLYRWWKYLQANISDAAFLKQGHFKLESMANFPLRGGLASSAAGFAACAAAVWAYCRVKQKKWEIPAANHMVSWAASDLGPDDLATISRWARWGSGSAARSVAGPCMLWGTCPGEEMANDDFAIIPSFAHHTAGWMDAVVVVEENPKKVSSSVGHQLMQKHPAAAIRYAQAAQNLQKMITAWQQHDLKTILDLIEQEAWMLVALMLTSDPPFQVLTPATLEVIGEVQSWRCEENIAVAFSLDAGPNVHILAPPEAADTVQKKVGEKFSRWPLYFNRTGDGIKLQLTEEL